MAMDSSSAQSHHQEMSSETLESMLISRKSQQEKKPMPADHVQSPKCPRCDSNNTKFCYYNNYSLSQPRYFCKSCRRYWTKGGTLRNVPVGGGCRKNRRSSSSSSSSLKRSQDHQPMTITTPCSNIIIPSFNIPYLSYGSDDFSLAFPSLQNQTNGQLGLDDEGGFRVSTANPNMPFSDIFQNMCYGMGDGINLGLGINGGIMGINQEMGLEEFNGGTTTSTAINTTMKQEICSNDHNSIGIIREGDQISRGLWGFPLWQSDNNFGGDGNMVGDVDSGRHGSWNGIGSSNWHELLNSPLM